MGSGGSDRFRFRPVGEGGSVECWLLRVRQGLWSREDSVDVVEVGFGWWVT